jgi:hypothetical protein
MRAKSQIATYLPEYPYVRWLPKSYDIFRSCHMCEAEVPCWGGWDIYECLAPEKCYIITICNACAEHVPDRDITGLQFVKVTALLMRG